VPSPLIDMSIVCLLDAGIDSEIAKALPSTKAARHDKSVVYTLKRIYRRVTTVAFTEGNLRWMDRILHERPDVVFNLAESASPLEPSVAACLELCGCAYTGSGPLAIMLTNDKIKSRRLLRAYGLRVPEFVELSPRKPIRIDFDPPFIVRPASLSASTGLYADSVTMTADDVPRLAHRIWRRFSGPALCEEFIVGREFRVGMCEDGRGRMKSSAIFESFMREQKPGWAFRTFAIRNSPRITKANCAIQRYTGRPAHLVSALVGTSCRAVSVLNVEGYATLDIRLDRSGTPVILEVNSNPGLTAGSFWGRPSFSATIRNIVDAGMRRKQADG